MIRRREADEFVPREINVLHAGIQKGRNLPGDGLEIGLVGGVKFRFRPEHHVVPEFGGGRQPVAEVFLGKELFSAENERKVVRDPIVQFVTDALRKVKAEVFQFAVDAAFRQRTLQQAQTDVRPTKMRKRHIDEQDRHKGNHSAGQKERESFERHQIHCPEYTEKFEEMQTSGLDFFNRSP